MGVPTPPPPGPSWAYAWSITHILGKTKQYCQGTFHGDKKNDKKIAKKHMHINEKRRHCFRQYFGPVHMYPPLLFENEDLLLLFDLVCFVLFSPVFFLAYRGQQCIRWQRLSKMHLIKMLSKVETFEYVCFSFTCRLTKKRREVFEHHDVINHMPREAIVFPSFLNCVDGPKLWKRYVWKHISKNIRIRVDELLFIIYQNDYNLLRLAILIFRVSLDL